MTLELRETDDGILIPVQVVLRASRTGIDGEVEGALRVRLAARRLKARPIVSFLSSSRSGCGWRNAISRW